jgi:hypothetical protein
VCAAVSFKLRTREEPKSGGGGGRDALSFAGNESLLEYDPQLVWGWSVAQDVCEFVCHSWCVSSWLLIPAVSCLLCTLLCMSQVLRLSAATAALFLAITAGRVSATATAHRSFS